MCPHLMPGLAEIKTQTKAAMNVEPYVALMQPTFGTLALTLTLTLNPNPNPNPDPKPKP